MRTNRLTLVKPLQYSPVATADSVFVRRKGLRTAIPISFRGTYMFKQHPSGFARTFSSWCAILAVIFLCASPIAFGQAAGTASIQGTVTDPTGAAVGNANVTLTNTNTGTTRTTVSDGSGLYALPNVPVGPYSLTVEAQGFSGFTQKGVLEVGNNIQINPELK